MSLSDDRRPNPDQLLAEQADAEARTRAGRLKVFFGAAPGVGKTYAMLEEARARAAEGVDVVVGYAEPHIRPETEALLFGLDLLKPRLVEYRGRVFKEFDLDAALARKPSLLCVDELAHTNSPGLRHEKRWQDVFELLDAGIDVFSTLNVQHLDSVNDIVERITGVEVRETLPDEVLDRADEIELIDTTPDELTKRLLEGKVYRPDIAERAIRQFFNKGNLTALREMALRRTAERVDAQMREHRQRAKVRQTWAASERVLVCIGPSPLSARLVRSARRLAVGLRAPWMAVFVETAQSAAMSKSARDRVNAHLQLAQQLGGEAITLTGHSLAQAVTDYARERNVTKIIIGKPDVPRWRERLFGSVVEDLIRHSGDIDVHVIRSNEPAAVPQSSSRRSESTSRVGYVIACAFTAAATALGLVLRQWAGLSEANIILVLILGVVATAWFSSRRGALLASGLTVLSFNFFFVEPLYTFSTNDPQYLITFLILLLTGLLVSTLVRTTRSQADLFRRRQLSTQALLDFTVELAGVNDGSSIAQVAAVRIGRVSGCDCTVFLRSDDSLVPAGQHGAPFCDDPKELAVARWVLDHSEPAGRALSTLPNALGRYLPLPSTGDRPVGVVGLRPVEHSGVESADDQRLLDAMVRQAATAIERSMLIEEAREAWRRVEQEDLRNTLLSAVSHDLRTPLTAIIGSASALVDRSVALSDSARYELSQTILGESQRMERVISNLLHITRVEAGEMPLAIRSTHLGDLVERALARLRPRLVGRAVSVNVADDLPLVLADATSVDQVVSNLLENAIDHTPVGTPIDIAAKASPTHVSLSVSDRGAGIPPGAERCVFDKFTRLDPASDRRGLGLGLAICRAIIEAHHGRISVTQRSGGGSIFTFTLPRAAPDTKP